MGTRYRSIVMLVEFHFLCSSRSHIAVILKIWIISYVSHVVVLVMFFSSKQKLKHSCAKYVLYQASAIADSLMSHYA